jgi:hypothetical protein
MARPLLFEVKLTDAERSKRYRDRRRQELEELRAGASKRAGSGNKATPPKEGRGPRGT